MKNNLLRVFVGTGSNAAYIEYLDRVDKWSGNLNAVSQVGLHTQLVILTPYDESRESQAKTYITLPPSKSTHDKFVRVTSSFYWWTVD